MIDSIVYFFGIVWIFSILCYVIPQLWIKFRGVQNLKVKYNAEWALVTGGSSGIGKSMVEKLAGQGLNIVVVAFPDKTLDEAMVEYEKTFPGQKFRKVGVNLSEGEYMKEIIQATKDIKVNIVISNAGFMKTGFFAKMPIDMHVANLNCNFTAAMRIAHHFANHMQENKLKGCITFTSSPASFMPCPFSSLYGATKCCLTLFAQSIAPELHPFGIDVAVVHPSPVASKFYQGNHQIDAIKFFMTTAKGPSVVADATLSGVGRVVTIDEGYYPLCVKTLLKLVDVTFMGEIINLIVGKLPEFKQLQSESVPTFSKQ